MDSKPWEMSDEKIAEHIVEARNQGRSNMSAGVNIAAEAQKELWKWWRRHLRAKWVSIPPIAGGQSIPKDYLVFMISDEEWDALNQLAEGGE